MALPERLDRAELVRLGAAGGDGLMPIKEDERAFRLPMGGDEELPLHEVEVVLRLRVNPKNGRPSWYRQPDDKEVVSAIQRAAEAAEEGETRPTSGWMSEWEEARS